MFKLEPSTIKQFRKEQEEYGTEIALYNVLWQVFAGLFSEVLGITRIKTYAENNKIQGKKDKNLPK